jgi:hypothetical protein
MPTIEIPIFSRIGRHLAAVRLMSYMVFPDDEKLRTAAEITFRTKLGDWYSETFENEKASLQRRFLRAMGPVLGDELPEALANPSAWMRNRFFNDFLEPAGGIIRGAVALTESPSAEDVQREWTGRWWSTVYTGKLIALIGSIHQHHEEVGASVNKAIHILCATEGNDKQRMSDFRRFGFPGVYESSLKKAWVKFRPVAHLCGAYVTTETHYYAGQLSRHFGEYWKQPPAFYDDRVFQQFCLLAKWVEMFASSFFPRGQRQPLIPKDEIFALPDEIFGPELPLQRFRALTDQEFAALKTYRAPKQFA